MLRLYFRESTIQTQEMNTVKRNSERRTPRKSSENQYFFLKQTWSGDWRDGSAPLPPNPPSHLGRVRRLFAWMLAHHSHRHSPILHFTPRETNEILTSCIARYRCIAWYFARVRFAWRTKQAILLHSRLPSWDLFETAYFEMSQNFTFRMHSLSQHKKDLGVSFWICRASSRVLPYYEIFEYVHVWICTYLKFFSTWARFFRLFWPVMIWSCDVCVCVTHIGHTHTHTHTHTTGPDHVSHTHWHTHTGTGPDQKSQKIWPAPATHPSLFP